MQILNIFHVLIAIALVAIVLVQRGQGATAGAAFGAGASGTVFGSRGAGNFLTRTTTWLAIGFFAISLGMAVMASRMNVENPEVDLGVMSGVADGEQVQDTELPLPPDRSLDQSSGSEVPVIDIPEAVQQAAERAVEEAASEESAAADGGEEDSNP